MDTFEPGSISGFPRYRVDRFGRVWSERKRRRCWVLLRPVPDHAGYLMVHLRNRRSHGLRKVHRLVLEAYVGPCPEGMQCRHLNGKRDDNRLSNLAWGTPRDNAADRVSHGTDNKGERHNFVKLTTDEVLRIRGLRGQGQTLVSIARRFGISKQQVSKIVRRQRWAHV